MEIVTSGQKQRREQIERELGRLAYKKLGLTLQMEKLDKSMASLEAMAMENDQVAEDLQTQATVDHAKAKAEAEQFAKKKPAAKK